MVVEVEAEEEVISCVSIPWESRNLHPTYLRRSASDVSSLIMNVTRVAVTSCCQWRSRIAGFCT